MTLTIACSIDAGAEIVSMHSLHNFALVKYDPLFVGAPIQTPQFAIKCPKRVEDTILYGFFDGVSSPIIAKTTVAEIVFCSMPSGMPPQYRAANFDAIGVHTSKGQYRLFGVLAVRDVLSISAPAPARFCSFPGGEWGSEC